MKVSELKAFLENFSDDQEITVLISTSVSDDEPIMTYAIGYGENEFGEPALQVDGF